MEESTRNDGVDATAMINEYRRFVERMITNSFAALGHGDESAHENGRVDVQKLLHGQMDYLQKQTQLWQAAGQAMLGEALPNVVDEASRDRRFSDSDWQDNPLFSLIRQSYLLNSELLSNTLESLDFESGLQGEQLKFFTRQYINALSPSNNPFANPEVCRMMMESQGQNLQLGLQNLLRDWQNSPQQALRMTQTDESAFKVGENLATTPGSVIYQNEVMQLIQYEPTTEKVFAEPLLITPPYINKYYVLDLDERKSLVRWLVDKGYTVFMISWVNPDARMADVSFGDYAMQGPVEALKVIRKITRFQKVHLMGYCVGGTLASMSAALLEARGKDWLASLTLLTTLLDFSQPGEVRHYLTETSWPLFKQQVQQQGFMDGRSLSMGFSLLRENQLFWPYFINNYLKGESPDAFDILYWNSDSTHIPAANYIEYIETTYLQNLLTQPGGFSIDGTPIDLSLINVPVYFMAARSDHIVLWDAAYQGTQLLKAPVRFVLGGSGHLAGVINPEGSGKYGYWTNASIPDLAEDWLGQAEGHEDSWWVDWFAWSQKNQGASEKLIRARKIGNPSYPALEVAPGSYVKVRL